MVRTSSEHVDRGQGETCCVGRVWDEEEKEKGRTEQHVGGKH